MLRFQLGCDPELFLADVGGNLRASCGLIGGTKEQPQPLGIGDGYAVQEDNVAVEFNIPPAANMREFVSSVAKAYKVVNDGVNSSYGFHIDTRSAAIFPEEELESEAAKVFGCDPDYNAWTGEKNPKPKADDWRLRSCGGHVHVGFDKKKVDVKRLIKCMDATLGVPSVLMDREGNLRRNLYGKRGAYRDKPYGAEYRVLSNFWVREPKLCEWVWNQTGEALALAISPFNIDAYNKDIESIINDGDITEAWLFCKELGFEVVHV